jgi:hypothetical protein
VLLASKVLSTRSTGGIVPMIAQLKLLRFRRLIRHTIPCPTCRYGFASIGHGEPRGDELARFANPLWRPVPEVHHCPGVAHEFAPINNAACARSNSISRKIANTSRLTVLFACLLALSFLPAAANAQSPTPNAAPTADAAPSDEDDTALAKKLQNPIGDLYSVPFQNNTNFDYGPHKATQDNLNIQPVIPIHINADWNIITRTILPLVWQPTLQPAQTVPFGTAPTTFSAFLSPASPVNGWLWAVGPVIQIPTISSATLGSNVWGAGPTAAIVYMKGPWVAGALANTIWSFGGTPGLGGTSYNSFLTQPFVNYNFGGGWYVNTAPIITAAWPALHDKAWTLPVGGGVGKIVRIGGVLPGNLSLGAYYNAVRPEFGATWQLRTQVTFIF